MVQVGGKQSIVDAKGAGLTVCPKCKHYSVNEKGWCYNGCNINAVMLDIQKQIQEKLGKEKERPYHNLFFAKIKEYNKTKDFYSHYVHLKDGTLMIIEFRKSCWEFDVVKLEDE